MDGLVYPRERSLGTITLVIGLIGWLAVIAGTFGIVLIYLLAGFIGYLFAHSAFISYIKGTGARLSPDQFPDLHARFEACCEKLGVPLGKRPEAYLLHGDGMFNAFAARFLGRDFVILLSDVVDAMEEQPEGINFYIGHELGHIRMKHLTGRIWRWPALWIPLLGAAYARAQESTCDLHGLACCQQPEQAARAMAALSAGARRWASLSLPAFRDQAKETGGFWMSFHELTGGYPWLSKRIARVTGHGGELPSRHGFAWVLAIFVPYTGRLGGGAAAPLMLIAIIGILAAVALPAYQDYQVRTKMHLAYSRAKNVSAALTEKYMETQQIPESLSDVGVTDPQADGVSLELNSGNMVLSVHIREGGFLLVPRMDDEGRVQWTCRPDDETPVKLLPLACRGGQ